MSDQIEQANEKRKLIVSTNNLGASNMYRNSEPASPTTNSTQDIKPVVKYEPKKETFWSKCKKAVFGTEHIDNIPEYLVLKVFIPAMKQTAYDMFCGGLGMMFGMEKRKGGKDGYSGYFRSSSSRDRDEDDDYDERMPNSYRDIGFYTESDANDVYEEMLRYIRNKGYVTVLDFYGISDRKSPHSRRDDNRGWDAQDLRGRRFYKSRGRWYIDLPEPTNVDSLVRL